MVLKISHLKRWLQFVLGSSEFINWTLGFDFFWLLHSILNWVFHGLCPISGEKIPILTIIKLKLYIYNRLKVLYRRKQDIGSLWPNEETLVIMFESHITYIANLVRMENTLNPGEKHDSQFSPYDWDWDSLENKDASPTVTNVTPAEEIRRYLLLHISGEMI